MQVSRGDIVLHLTEHHGDCCPGGKVYIETKGLKEYYQQISAKDYKYNKPALDISDPSCLEIHVIDPCGNKLLFNERL